MRKYLTPSGGGEREEVRNGGVEEALGNQDTEGWNHI